MKKILMINSEFPPLGGGQGRANENILKELSKSKDLHIDVITASVDNKKVIKLSDNITLYFLNIQKNGKDLHFQTIKNLLIFSWKALRKAQKLKKEVKYDVVLSWSGIPSGFLGWTINIPNIILLRGCDVPFYEKRWRILDTLIFQWLSPFIWKRAKVVIANSEGLKKMAQNISPKQKIKVLPNGVDTKYFTPRSTVKKQKGEVIILAVGRLIERKNFSMIIEATALLKKKKNINIHLVGDGPEKDALLLMAKEKNISLTLLGKMDNKQLLKQYHQADVFCLPSKNEGMSNAVLEAISCGLPCIVNNTGGMKELVEDGRNGYVLEKNTKEQLKNSLEKLIHDNHKRKLMGVHSRKKAEQMDWKNTAKKLQRYWSS